jgi:hypothetical protein
VITEKQLQKQHNIAITKKPVQKAKTLPQKKRKVHKNIAEFPIHKFKRKKDVKLPHHRKEYFQTATRNMSCTIKAKTHGYNMFFYPTGPKSSQTGCCHLRNQEGVTQF